MGKKHMPLIYVCSPYRGDVELNVRNAQYYCRLVMEQGGIPFAPHLLFTQFLDDSNASERQQGLDMGAELLKRCDALWVFGHPTVGMEQEIALAKQLKKPIKTHDQFGGRRE